MHNEAFVKGSDESNGVVCTGDRREIDAAIRPHTPSDFMVENCDDNKCGLWCCKPRCLQVFTQPKWLLVALCVLSFVQGFVVNGINNVNTTSYERRFQLTAREASAVSSAYDFSAGVLVLPLSYFGSIVHKPRMVAVAAVLLACGSLSMSLPHMITGHYEVGEGFNRLCNATKSECDTTTNLPDFLYLLIFGQVLHGIAGTILYTVGVAALDDNVDDRNSPLYIGILYFSAAFGPALGFICGGFFLQIYVDFDHDVKVSLTTDDPRWVGAWWLGFCVAFGLASIVGSLFFLFPRETPKACKLRADRAHTNPDGREQQHVTMKLAVSHAPATTWQLIRNPTFILISLAGAMETLVGSGFGTFLPKFIRNQYNQTDGRAALITGALAIPGIAGGQFFGGYIVKRTGWKVKGMLRFNAVVCAVVMVFGAVLFAQCPQNKVAGVNIPYHLDKQAKFSVNMDATCNSQCNCHLEHYEPLCMNNVEYFNPCYAGCQNQTRHSDTKEYYNCSCIAEHTPDLNTTIHGIGGKCDGESCVYLYIFAPFFFCVMLFTFIAGVPASSSTLRCVADKDKAYALGVQWIFIRFLGSVPGPLIFGAIIDSVCILWQKVCGKDRSCWIYDNAAMSRNLFLILLVCKGLSMIFFVIGSIVFKPPHSKDVANVFSNDKNGSTMEKQDNGDTSKAKVESSF